MIDVNGSQDRFLGRLREALADTEIGFQPPAALAEPVTGEDGGAFDSAALLNASDEEKKKRLDLLMKEADEISLQVTVVNHSEEAADVIRQLVSDRSPEWGTDKQVAVWDHPLLKELRLPDVLGSLDVPVHETRMKDPGEKKELRKNIRDSFVGVTSADFCIAESATLVMKNRPGQARSVSLLPLVHVAVIRQDQIIPDLKSLYRLLEHDPRHVKEGLTNAVTMVTGPSKTADIEATLVLGAHGPKEVHLIVIK